MMRPSPPRWRPHHALADDEPRIVLLGASSGVSQALTTELVCGQQLGRGDQSRTMGPAAPRDERDAEMQRKPVDYPHATHGSLSRLVMVMRFGRMGVAVF